MIVGILGKAGSGKDTVADMLVKNGFCKIAFADPIKRFCMEIFDFSEEQLWGPSELRSQPDKRYLKFINGVEDARALQAIDMACGNNFPLEHYTKVYLTPRDALQKIGTEGGRAAYDPVWVEYTIRKAQEMMQNPNIEYDRVEGFYKSHYTVTYKGIVISDCRFENEVQAIKDTGGIVIKVDRDGAGLDGERAQHQSETEQDSMSEDIFNHIIYNNFSLEDLKKEVDKILSFY